MSRPTLPLCAAAALVVLTVGCGGGGGGGFAAAANAACGEANREIAALRPPRGQVDMARYVGKTEAIVLRLRRKLDELDGAGAGAREYLTGLQRSGTLLNEMYDAARSRNPDAVSELSDQLAEVRLARLANAVGLETCAQQPSPPK